MKPECEAAVRAAAGDRELSKSELRGIEQRLVKSAQAVRRADPAAWSRMTQPQKYVAAAKLARETHLSDMADAHRSELQRIALKQRNDAITFAVKPGDQVKSLLSRHFMLHDAGGGDSSIEGKLKAAEWAAMGQFSPEEERALADPSLRRDIVGEIYGENSGNAEARGLAQKWKKVSDQVVQDMKDAGIPINPRDDWRLPQHQEWTRLAAEGENEWVQDHKNWLDHNAFINPDGSDMSAEQVDHFLREAFMTIHTDGANKRAEGTVHSGHGKIGGQFNAPRQLHYKDADSYLAAMDKYGTAPDLMSAIREHLKRRARATTLASIEGPSGETDVLARADRAYANDLAVANSEKQKKAIRNNYNRFRQMFAVQVHGLQQPAHAGIASAMSLVRSVVTWSKLGTLWTQQPSDALMSWNMLRQAGIGIDKGRFTSSLVKGVLDKTTKENLRLMGAWSDNMHAQAKRFDDTELLGSKSRWINATGYKISGMRALDRGNTSAIVDQVLYALGKYTRSHATVDSLPESMKTFTSRFGITQDHWDVMRASELNHGLGNHPGYVTPQGVFATPDEALRPIAERRAAASGTDVGVETRNLRTETVRQMMGAYHELLHAGGRGYMGSSLNENRRMGLLGNEAGTPMGELIRALWTIRGTPWGMMYTHMFDVPRGIQGGWVPKMAYRARYVAGQMVATAIATQIKRLIRGDDPQDFLSMQFAKEEAAGAVLGPMLATFMFGSQGDEQTLADAGGPIVQAGAQFANLIMRGRDPGKRFEGDKYGSQWLAFVRGNATPFMNTWYAKAVFNHMVYQQLQEMISPGYNERVQKRLDQRGESTWWNQGEALPSRAPDFSQAVQNPNP